MTSLPAQVYRIPDRGGWREGMAADVVVFDLDSVRDNATFTEPHQLSQGMVHVFVNGQAAVRNGEFTGILAGKVLLKERYQTTTGSDGFPQDQTGRGCSQGVSFPRT